MATAMDIVVGGVVFLTLFVLIAKSGATVRGLETWWESKALPLQLFYGGIAAFVLWLVWATILIRIVAWAWTGQWMPLTTDKDGIATLGQLGDLFGGVNALFAAFAFVGVAIAAYYQHKTFVLQREQNVRQAFEPLFFKLLEEHTYPSTLVPEFLPSKALIPKKEFSECVGDLRAHLVTIAEAALKEVPPRQLAWDLFSEAYETFYAENESTLGPYFRKLFHIFKLIARSDLHWDEKVQYANIARASLDTNQLMLLVLNCGSARGTDFKPYVEGFGLLKHIRTVADKGAVTIDLAIARAVYRSTATMDAAARERYWKESPNERPRWATHGKQLTHLP